MNYIKYISSSLILLTMVLVSACDTDPQWVYESEESERYSFTQFIKGIEKFPYIADQSKLSRVRIGFKQLSLEIRKDDIKKIMGAPDTEMFSYKSKEKNREFIYSTWIFYMKRFERNLFTSNFDETIVLYFKPNEELYWVLPSNVVAFKPLGGPHLHPEAL